MGKRKRTIREEESGRQAVHSLREVPQADNNVGDGGRNANQEKQKPQNHKNTNLFNLTIWQVGISLIFRAFSRFRATKVFCNKNEAQIS
jgi:hypothetical protein